jgi:hypothetical protein
MGKVMKNNVMKIWEDIETSLTWQVNDLPSPMSWDDTHEYISKLNSDNYEGFSDWRMPTILEYATLYDRNNEIFGDKLINKKTNDILAIFKSEESIPFVLKEPFKDSMYMKKAFFWTSDRQEVKGFSSFFSSEKQYTDNKIIMDFQMWDNFPVSKKSAYAFIRCVRG